MSEQHYTFGDTALAEERLSLLARTYEPATRALLAVAGVPPGSTVADLGCGPGHSTRLLAEVLRPGQLIGIDRSRTYLEAARRTGPGSIRYLEHDVAAEPLPVPAGSWLFCRFLLTHLHEPEKILRGWRRSVGTGGLILQETAELRSDLPPLARYYDIVAALQAHYGQALNIGRELTRLATAAGWTILATRESSQHLPVPVMATLHLMNLRTWRSDPFVSAHFGIEELERLERGLEAARQGTGRFVQSVLGEAVLTCR